MKLINFPCKKAYYVKRDFFPNKKNAFYGLDTDPEPEPEP